MNWIKKLRSLALIVFAFGFLFSATLSSCGNKKSENEKTENPADTSATGSDHPEGSEVQQHTDSMEVGGEHPDSMEESGNEHPESAEEENEHPE